jgi:hypothetical protein
MDETITAADFVHVAQDAGAALTYFSADECWSANQYPHVCIERHPDYWDTPKTQGAFPPTVLWHLVRKRNGFMKKQRLLKMALGIDI